MIAFLAISLVVALIVFLVWMNVMITASMNKVEINQQMWKVAKESSVVKACTQKFFKSCRKLPKSRVVMTRKFFHTPPLAQRRLGRHRRRGEFGANSGYKKSCFGAKSSRVRSAMNS